MSQETHRLTDDSGLYEAVAVTTYDSGQCTLMVFSNDGAFEYLPMSKSQTAALRDLLNKRYASPFADESEDALAGLDLHAVGNPMAEPGAVVASVPVQVKTGGESR